MSLQRPSIATSPRHHATTPSPVDTHLPHHPHLIAGNDAAGAGTADADLGAINKPVMDRMHMEIGDITKGNQASGSGTADADLGAINKPVMERKAMEIADV